MATVKKTYEAKLVVTNPENFEKCAEKVERIIADWPDWKKSTRATSYPRENTDFQPKS